MCNDRLWTDLGGGMREKNETIAFELPGRCRGVRDVSVHGRDRRDYGIPVALRRRPLNNDLGSRQACVGRRPLLDGGCFFDCTRSARVFALELDC